MVKFAFVWKSASIGAREILDSIDDGPLYPRDNAVGSSQRLNVLRTALVLGTILQVYFIGVHIKKPVEGVTSSSLIQSTEEGSLFAPTLESFSVYTESKNITKKVVIGASISEIEKPMATSSTKVLQTGTISSSNETRTARTEFFESDFISPTLALVDPIFMGGFRNQHMRFVAFAEHARKRNIPSLLLPSLQWGNNAIHLKDKQKRHKSVPVVTRVPHSYLFDVDHWNQLAWKWKQERDGKARTKSESYGFGFQTARAPKALNDAVSTFESPPMLPFLVPYHPKLHADWDNVNKIFQDVPPEKVLDPNFNPRRTDLMQYTTGKSMPFSYGSGRGAGRLWDEYYQTIIKEEIIDPSFAGSNTSNATAIPTIQMEHRGDMEIAIYQALKPSIRLQPVVDRILYNEDYRNINRSNSAHNYAGGENSTPSLIVIHPRCEIDMLLHRCGRKMTRNLTQIIQMIEESPHFNKPNSGTGMGEPLYERVLLCVARDFMAPGSMDANGDINTLVKQNWDTLNRVTGKSDLKEGSFHGLWNGKVQVAEAGEDAAISIPDLPVEAVELVAQVLNFFVAVNAAVFVGTFGSSYSTDVWTVRYHLGKGRGNFFHSPTGIQKVPNGGLPHPHRCK